MVNDWDIKAVVPNKFSQLELFKFMWEMQFYDFDADCRFGIIYNEALSNNDEIVLTGHIYKPC